MPLSYFQTIKSSQMPYLTNSIKDTESEPDSELKPSDEEMHQTILARCTKKRYTHQTTLIKAGSSAEAIYYVEQGFAYLFHYSEKKLVVPFIAREGYWITDKRSFYGSPGNDADISSESIVVAQGSVLHTLRRESYLRLIRTRTDIELNIQKKRADVSEEERNILILLQSASAHEKIKWLLHAFPGIAAVVTHKVLAAYLSMTEYTFSRKLKEI